MDRSFPEQFRGTGGAPGAFDGLVSSWFVELEPIADWGCVMKYRTRLTLLIVTLAMITNGVLVGISYWLTRGILVDEIQSQILSIASTAAVMVDGDLHKQISTKADEDGRAYRELEAQLRQFRDSNRRDDVYIRYVYTMIPAPTTDENPYGAVFVVDAEERDTGKKSHVGDPVETSSENVTPLDITRRQIDDIFVDEYGTWVCANAPIYDANGQAVASLGVDMDVKDVLTKTHLLLKRGLMALAVAGGLAVGISMLLSRHVTRPLDLLTATIQKIGQGDLGARVDLVAQDEFGQVGQAVNDMAAALRDRELLKGALARYLSYQVAEHVIRSGITPDLRGERRKITVLFLDIRNFSDMADGMAPEKVVEILNEFFESMIDIVFKHQGMLDKFTGDGLMAIFGAPFDDERQELHACEAALEMQHELEGLRDRWDAQGREKLKIGMGINTGIAVVGNIGSTQRMDYTAIGDTVNVAARLESATKDHDVSILISQSTHDALGNGFRSSFLADLRVKGHCEPISTYTLEGTQAVAQA